MKIRLLVSCFLVLLILSGSEIYASTANSFTLYSFQDSLAIELLTEPRDTAQIDKDSLQRFVPYLDDVEADSESQLLAIYMVLIALSTFFSEDLAAIGAGIMAANGMIPFWPAVIAVILGILVADFTLYLAGRWVGKPILKLPPFKWMVEESTLESSVKWFKSRGPYLLFLSRFIPGSRIPVYISAGILDTGFWTFLFYFGGTVLIWTPIFVWISMLMGNEILAFYDRYDQYVIWVILATVLSFYILYRIIPLTLTPPGRRFLRRKIRGFFRK